MINKKYTSDYRLENNLLPDGRIKTVPIYIGKRFVYKSDNAKLKKTRSKLAILTTIAYVTIIISFIFYSNVGKTMYVALPFAFAFLPLGFQFIAILNVYTIKTPMTREQKDKTYDRLALSSFLCILLSLVTFAGAVIFFIISKKKYITAPNIAFMILLIAFIASEAIIFINRKNIEIMEMV